MELQQNPVRRASKRKPYRLVAFFVVISGVSLIFGCVPVRPAHAQVPEGTPIDVIRSTAMQGDAQSQYALGRAYEEGLGVQPDVKEAVKWYAMAAEQGLHVAQYVLGTILFHGEGGVAPDYAQARKWLAAAAMAGIPAAQRDLGRLHERGLGGEPDPIWAWVWYHFAATGGDLKADQFRDALSRRMDPSALTEAKRLAADIAPQVAPAPRQDPPR